MKVDDEKSKINSEDDKIEIEEYKSSEINNTNLESNTDGEKVSLSFKKPGKPLSIKPSTSSAASSNVLNQAEKRKFSALDEIMQVRLPTISLNL